MKRVITAALLSVYFRPFRSQYLLDCYVRYTVRIALKSSVDAQLKLRNLQMLPALVTVVHG